MGKNQANTRDREILKSNVEFALDKAREKTYSYYYGSQTDSFYYKENKWISQMADLFGVDKMKVAGIYSAFSPMRSVSENKMCVIEYLRMGTCKTTKNQLEKAEKIMLCDSQEEIERVLNGLKTVSFFRDLMLFYNDLITIDRHMMKLAPSNWGSLTNKRYKLFSSIFKTAAYRKMPSKTVGTVGAYAQSLVWEDLRKAT